MKTPAILVLVGMLAGAEDAAAAGRALAQAPAGRALPTAGDRSAESDASPGNLPVPGACLPPGAIRSFSATLDKPGTHNLYQVPPGRLFIVTDAFALHRGDVDGYWRLLAGDDVRAVLPVPSLDSAATMIGIHFESGIRFEGGETIVVNSTGRWETWVTLSGYEVEP